MESEQQQQPTQKPLVPEKRFMSTLPQGDQGVPTSEHSKSQQRSYTSGINEPTSSLKEEPSLAEGGLSFQDTSSDQITSSPKPAPIKVVEEELESSVISQDTIIQPTPSDQVTSSSSLPKSSKTDSSVSIKEESNVTSVSSQSTSPQETEPATSDQVIPSLTKPDSIVSEEPKPDSKPSDQDHLVSRKINVDKEFVEKAVEEAMKRKYGEKVAADSAKKTLSYIHKPASWFIGLLH